MAQDDRVRPDDLHIFTRVARVASFTEASRQLGIPRATVSTALARLERRLGTRLLQRTTRSVRLTSDGQILLDACVDLLADLEALGTLFQQGQGPLSGRLRVDMPLGLAAGVLMQRLPEFLAAHPALELEVHSTDRRVDVIAEGFDCVIRGGPVVDESLAARTLGLVPLRNVAAPSYLAACGTPRSLDDLEAHRLVGYQPNPSDPRVGFEYLDGETGAVRQRAMRTALVVNNSTAYGAACRAGLGIAQIPLASVAKDLARGELVEILPQLQPPPLVMHLLFPHRRQLAQRVRVFADWVAATLALQR